MDAEDLTIRPGDAEPIYRQIMDQLRRLIASDRLVTGQLLPSVREVAGRHAVNPMTVSRAYGLLERDGLITRQRGIGMVVAASRGGAQSDDRRLAQLEPELQNLARQAHELGLSNRIVLQRLKDLLEKQ